MKLTHSELCAALIIIGGERVGMSAVRPEEIEHLATLSLVCYEDGNWWLTPAGEKLLPKLINGDEIDPLI